jgi:hypothetical protein
MGGINRENRSNRQLQLRVGRVHHCA